MNEQCSKLHPHPHLARKQPIHLLSRPLHLLDLAHRHLRPTRTVEGRFVIEAANVRDAEPVGDDLAPAVGCEVLKEELGGGEDRREERVEVVGEERENGIGGSAKLLLRLYEACCQEGRKEM